MYKYTSSSSSSSPSRQQKASQSNGGGGGGASIRALLCVWTAIAVVAVTLFSSNAPPLFGARAELVDASIVQVCIRDDPAADATVDINCTRVRNDLTMRFRATPTAGAGEIARIVMNSPEFAAIFNNRSSGSDPNAPQVVGFRETSIVVTMSDLRIRYATRFWMMVPEEIGVWASDSVSGFVAEACNPAATYSAGHPAFGSGCTDNQNKAVDSLGDSVGTAIIPQSALPTPGCFQLLCGDCMPGSFRGGNDRNALNREKFWWARDLMRAYYIKPEPLMEYTLNVTAANPDNEVEFVLLGIQHGMSADAGVGIVFGHSDNSSTDPTNQQPWATKPDDLGPGRLFQSEGWSASQSIKARLISQARFGQPPPLHGLIIARDSTDPQRRGYHESRENPRALNAANCAIFTQVPLGSTNDSAELALSGVALCAVPENWMFGENNVNQLRVGDDCCSCLGITQESWYGVAAHRARSCFNTHFTCIPGHDFWSIDKSRTPRWHMREMQRFRKRQMCLMCTGDPLCKKTKLKDFDALTQTSFAGIFAPDASAANATSPVACDWSTIDADNSKGAPYLHNRKDRIDAVLLQSPPTGLPRMWSNSGRSNMWMYRGQLFYEAPDNLGMAVELVVTADALFSRVIERIPRIRIEPIDVGAQCTVVPGDDGEVWFRVINDSPFAATLSVRLTFGDPAYKIANGINEIQIGIGPAPAVVRKFFLISVQRPGNVPSPNGAQISFEAFDSTGQPFPGAAISVGCREEQKAFAGPAGTLNTGKSGKCFSGPLCEISNFLLGIIFIVVGVVSVVAILLIAKKVILHTGNR